MDENKIDGEELLKTQEMNSIQIPKISDKESENKSTYSEITPKDEFIEMNSADDKSKTLLMDSLGTDFSDNETLNVDAPVKRRRKPKKKKTNHTRTMGQIFLGAVISAAAICVGVVFAVNVIVWLRDFTGMAKQNIEAEIPLDETMTVSDIADRLQENDIISSPNLFKAYMNFMEKRSLKKYGEFELVMGPHTIRSNMSFSRIIEEFQTVKQYAETVTVTIPEGLTAAEIGRLLEENYVCRAADFEAYYRTKQNQFDFEEGIENNSYRLNMLEGYLFPDTYEFNLIDDMKTNPNMNTMEYARRAANKMYDNFENKITKQMQARMEDLGLTLDQTITLASLIQWEGTNEDNMANISSVFHNRLNNIEEYPNLQSDTTYTYINKSILPKVTNSNRETMQQVENAYDTYKCIGLPAGPICNPGLDAINAALYPSNTDYYYFLASSDGVFYWAQTQEQHDQNVQDAALQAAEEDENYE